MLPLEEPLYDALIVATKACQRLGYNPTYTLQMISESGPLGTCQRILATAQPSDGFSRLWELGRLDLTVANIVLRPQFADLFTEEERTNERRRLEELGYLTGGAG